MANIDGMAALPQKPACWDCPDAFPELISWLSQSFTVSNPASWHQCVVHSVHVTKKKSWDEI